MAQATIGIDCRLGGVRHGGIGRYIAEYVKRATADPTLRFALVFADESQRDELLSAIAANDRRRVSSVVAPIRHYSLAEQWALPRVFNKLAVDILHVPHFNVPLGYRRPLVVTIHDLLWHTTRGTNVTTLPVWYYWPKYGAYHITVGSTIKRARKIFVPTKYVAKTVTAHYPSAAEKLVVTYEGVGEQFTPDRATKRHPTQLLYVGSLYPHKNVTIILDALQLLPDHTLVVAGARDAFSEQFSRQVAERKLSDRVTVKGKIADAELVKLYRTAGALIQPSTSEGFGLTGLEALACQTSLIASDIPVFHEVYGQTAWYFQPDSAESLVTAITQAAGQPISNTCELERQQLLDRYSWDQMTATMLQSIKTIL